MIFQEKEPSIMFLTVFIGYFSMTLFPDFLPVSFRTTCVDQVKCVRMLVYLMHASWLTPSQVAAY